MLHAAMVVVVSVSEEEAAARATRRSTKADSSAAALSPTHAGAGMAPSSSELTPAFALAPAAARKSATGAVFASVSFVAIADALAAAAVVFLI